MNIHNSVLAQNLFDMSLQNHIVRKPIRYVIHAELVLTCLLNCVSAKLRICCAFVLACLRA